MIIRVLIAVVLAVPAYFYTMRYNIHMFQQNGYKNKEHLHWLKKKFRLQWILYFGLALGIVTCVFPYLALEIFEYLVLLVIIGTVNGAGAYALAEAIRYVQKIGFDFIEEREAKLTKLLMDGMKEIPAVHILGSQKAEDHHGIVTFKLDGVHPHDVASVLDADHIAVRAGHHCAQPLLQHLKVLSTTRVSLGVYNTEEEIQAFLISLAGIRRQMGYGE